jgi:hypothetical protein
VVNYINTQSGINLSQVFDQYLRYKNIPTLEFRFENGRAMARWVADVDGFNMPVRIRTKGGEYNLLHQQLLSARLICPV